MTPKTRGLPMFWYFVPFSGWLFGNLLLSSLTMPQQPPGQGVGIDKYQHVLFYALGAFLLCWSLAHFCPKWPMWRTIIISIIAISIWGWLDELYQLGTPGRSGGDWKDWLADSVGGVLGSVFYCISHALLTFLKTRRRRNQDPATSGGD